MSVQGKRSEHREDTVALAWRTLGLFLALSVFFLLSVDDLFRGEDFVLPMLQNAWAFLSLWGLNRALARLLNIHDARVSNTAIFGASDGPERDRVAR